MSDGIGSLAPTPATTDAVRQGGTAPAGVTQPPKTWGAPQDAGTTQATGLSQGTGTPKTSGTGKNGKAAVPGGDDTVTLSPEAKAQVAKLQARDTDVKAHEQAHLSAGAGIVTSGATYSYQRGPDGRMYAVGGEVSIDSSPVRGNPSATVAKALQIEAAALAPADPSSQDEAVAAQAASMAAQAATEAAKQGAAGAASGGGKGTQTQGSGATQDGTGASTGQAATGAKAGTGATTGTAPTTTPGLQAPPRTDSLAADGNAGVDGKTEGQVAAGGRGLSAAGVARAYGAGTTHAHVNQGRLDVVG